MLSKFDGGRRGGEDLRSERLLRDIDALNKAIYPDRSRPRTAVSTLSSRAKSVGKTSSSYPKPGSRQASEDPLTKDKKSFWNWKPLKAFSHIRSRRFNCCFSLQVHTIEGLPPAFDDVNICVHWKRRDGELASRPVRVSQGTAEFEEQLTHVCSVYGSRTGPHHSAKYDAKHFLLYASVLGTPELDLGRHRVDLTRLLPLTLEELEEEKCTAKWSTGYKLLGKAKGAVMNVSFGYSVVGDNYVAAGAARMNPSEHQKLRQDTTNASKPVVKYNLVDGRSAIRQPAIQLDNSIPKSHDIPRSLDDAKVLHEVFPMSESDLSSSVNMLDKKTNQEKPDVSVDCTPELAVSSDSGYPSEPSSDSFVNSWKEADENQIKGGEFSVEEHEIELPLKQLMKWDVDPAETVLTVSIEPVAGLRLKDQEKHDEKITVKSVDGLSTGSPHLVENDCNLVARLEETTELLSGGEEGIDIGDQLVLPECSSKDDICTKESLMNELESALNAVSRLEVDGMNSPADQDNYLETKSHFNMNRIRKSHSLDDVTDSVASEFLDLMGIEHSPFGMSSESEPDSPRECLLRQFEKDTLANGCDLFGFGFDDGCQVEFGLDAPTNHETDDLQQPSLVQDSSEYQGLTVGNQTKAKMLENLETEALMREWGLNEKAFQGSPPNSSGGFWSPIHLHPEVPPQLPPLGDGLGSFLQTKDGGILRSMNPALFRFARSGGSLIMQASQPIVVPAQMGTGVMEILQHLASIGIEKLSIQANKLMPLEDISGPRMQQMAWEAAAPDRQVLMDTKSHGCQTKGKDKPLLSRSKDFCSSSGSNGMDTEYVSLEELAPLAMEKIETLSIEGLRIQSGMSDEEVPLNISSESVREMSTLEGEGAAGLQLMDINGGDDGGDELMGLSLTLDEWMRLDSGEIGKEDQIDEQTSKILAAHHANHLGGLRKEKRSKGCRRKCGLLGNNFTVALMVQLRDPLRNYEPVGAPMLALIQVERLFVPPKPIIYSTISAAGNGGDGDGDGEEESEPARKEEFRITEIHVAGLKTDPGRNRFWGGAKQQQSGSRWLLANGMAKDNNKQPTTKSRAAAKLTPAGRAAPAAPAAPAAAASGRGWLRDSLWSISSRFSGMGAKCKEPASSSLLARNPNVVFSK